MISCGRIKYGTNTQATKTCTGLKLDTTQTKLQGNCSKSNGSVAAAEIDIGLCIGNDEGALKRGASKFKESCNPCEIDTNKALRCTCKKSNGTKNTSSLSLDSFVGNNEGVLQCTAGN
jgi:hypothetical protein